MSRSLMRHTRFALEVPVFLAPAYAEACLHATSVPAYRSFSSTAQNSNRGDKKKLENKDANKQRGVSALRSTGPRRKLQVDKYPLPQPSKNAESRTIPYEMNENHGLYQFFNANRDTMMPPSEEDSHGRAWTERELSKKDFHDLWKLHWTCVKETNRIATRDNERRRLKVGYGEAEISDRLSTVRATMANVRKVLIQRHEDHVNATMLLESKNLVDIFPDAESSIGIKSHTTQSSPFSEANEAQEPHSNLVQTPQELEQSRRPESQKLAQ